MTGATAYLAGLATCLATPLASEAGKVVPLNRAMEIWTNHCAHVRDVRGTIHLIGNGGSASIVAHAQNDLTKAGHVRANIYQDVPLLTAYSNDHGYHRNYSDALAIWIGEEDMLIAVSSSGASSNILNAVKAAKDASAVIVTCSGFEPDNPLRQCGDLNFYVPCSDYGHVEITHQALLHCLTDRLANAR